MKTNKLITLIFSLLLFCNLAVEKQSSIEQTVDLTFLSALWTLAFSAKN